MKVPGFTLRKLSKNVLLLDLTPHQCTSYNVLDQSYRNIANTDCQYHNTSECQICDKAGHSYTPNEWLGPNWYRFLEPAGTMMLHGLTTTTEVPTENQAWRGYLTGDHPTESGQTIDGYVCFMADHVSSGGYCFRNAQIKITNCGPYFVYELPDISGCSYRYSGMTPEKGTLEYFIGRKRDIWRKVQVNNLNVAFSFAPCGDR